MLSIMLFLFLFFIGLLAMFWYFYRRVEQNARILRDEHAQLRVLMRAMESHLDHMDRIETLRARDEKLASGDDDNPDLQVDENDNAGADPLLHLSFEGPRRENGEKDALDINFDPDPVTQGKKGDNS